MHLVNEAVMDPDLDGREILLKLFQQGRQLVQAHAVTGGQFNDAADRDFGDVQLPVQFIGEPDNFPAIMRLFQNLDLLGIIFELFEREGTQSVCSSCPT
jgi:hypothetical protein